MILPIASQTSTTLPQRAFHALQSLVQTIVDFVRKIFRAISNAPSILKYYVSFQMMESWVPSPLKAVITASYCYVRDLLTLWTQEGLQAKIGSLTQQKETLQKKCTELLAQIERQEKSLASLVQVGKLDQRIQDQLNRETSAVRLQLSSILLVNDMTNERCEASLILINNLQRQVNTLANLLQSNHLHFDVKEPFTPEDQARLMKYGITIEV